MIENIYSKIRLIGAHWVVTYLSPLSDYPD
jgi:hypothetical protein